MANKSVAVKPFKLEYTHQFRYYMDDALERGGVKAICYHCGTPCRGLCYNEDRCYTCFISDKHRNIMDPEDNWPKQLDDCLAERCLCVCHVSIQKVQNNMMLSRNGKQWVQIPQKTSGKEKVFRFMGLPMKVRANVYKYLFLPEIPDQRVNSPYHKGAIHKSILLVSRQIYEEAKTYPLKMNKLSFQSPIHGIDFFKLQLQPALAALITSITIELEARDAIRDQGDFRQLCGMLKDTNVERLYLIIRGKLHAMHVKRGKLLDTEVLDRLGEITNLKRLRLRFTTRTLSYMTKIKVTDRLRKKFEHRDDSDEEDSVVDPREESDYKLLENGSDSDPGLLSDDSSDDGSDDEDEEEDSDDEDSEEDYYNSLEYDDDDW